MTVSEVLLRVELYGKRYVPDTALSLTLASGRLNETATSTCPILFNRSIPNLISGFEVALKVTAAEALLKLNIGVNCIDPKPFAELEP